MTTAEAVRRRNDMKGFGSSKTARLMALSFAIALIGGGAAAYLAPPTSLYLMSLSVFVPIAMNIVGLPQALEEHGFAAILCAIVLPVALFLYMVGLGVLMAYASSAGIALVAAGVGALGFALRPRGTSERSDTSARSLPPAHAH
jgi:FtsH-binding integral membrane protein